MAREPGQRDRCACGAELIFLTNTKTGNLVPVEVRASLVYVMDSNGTHCSPVETHRTTELGGHARATQHLNHFQTCPKRDRFRRP